MPVRVSPLGPINGRANLATGKYSDFQSQNERYRLDCSLLSIVAY